LLVCKVDPRGRPSHGHRQARVRPGVGPHSASAVPWPERERDSLSLSLSLAPGYDIHCESPGVPDPPPVPGFRDTHMIALKMVTVGELALNLIPPRPTLYGRVSRDGKSSFGKGERHTRTTCADSGPPHGNDRAPPPCEVCVPRPRARCDDRCASPHPAPRVRRPCRAGVERARQRRRAPPPASRARRPYP
jgi:hypothetical protein